LDNLAKYKVAFVKVFNVPEDSLGEDFVFGQVPGWDSVAHLALISELEDTFDIMFDSEDILHYGSYLNGIEILRRYDIAF